MANKQINYFVAFLVVVLYLLATIAVNGSYNGSAAAHNPEAGCWPKDVFLPLAVSDYINYFPGTQEAEPNNSYQEANGPLVSGISYSGLFNDERDFFSIYVQTAGQINIKLSTAITTEVQLQLFYQSTDNRVGFDPSTPYEIIHNGQPGWYYIFIYSGINYPTPPTYNLTATYPVLPTPTPHTPIPTPTCPPTSISTNTFTPTPTRTNTPTPTPTATLPSGWYEVGANSASGGGISNTSGGSERPSVALSPNGMLYVAWNDDTEGNQEIYVRRWNGNSWAEVGTNSASNGGISNNSGNSWYPHIAVAPDNTPYIVWYDNSVGNYEIYVRRWNGSSWIEVGSGSANGGGISNNSGSSFTPTIAIAPDNTPYVVWRDGSSGDNEIYVRRWNGTTWAEVSTGSATGGGISNNVGSSLSPSIAIASDNTPFVTWQDSSSGNSEIYILRWNGSNWVEVGNGSANGGGISNNSGNSSRPTIAISVDNKPHVAWQDDDGGNIEIYVRSWNGNNWEEIGSGSASGGGISNTFNDSQYPTIAVTSNNIPYITWNDGSFGNEEIYVRRWNGSIWAEVGIGSASGGGISNTSGSSTTPSIKADTSNTPYITWGENSEIYILQWLE